MVRRHSRLSRSQDFDHVYRSGRSVANRYLVLYFFARPEEGLPGVAARDSRVGFSVSKRLGSAVERNRVKRSLREAYRVCEHRLRSNLDFVLIARGPMTELLDRGGGVEEKVLEVFSKASLLVPHKEQRTS
jgi:ribonuclease P protein component, eubacterial